MPRLLSALPSVADFRVPAAEDFQAVTGEHDHAFAPLDRFQKLAVPG